MGKENKRHGKCSTSTDVEAEHALNKGTKPLQKAERDLENLETDVNPKKQKIQNKQIEEVDLEPKSKKQKKQKKHKKSSEKKEMKKLRKSFKEMTETMRNLQEFMQGKASLEGMQLRAEDIPRNVKAKAKEEEPTKKTEELATPECCFDTADARGNNLKTIFVKGFDTSLRRDEIRRALSEHFSSCGKVRRVFVPIECKTGVSIGYAFIDVKDYKKALQLSGSYIGKCQLDVRMALYQEGYCGILNFHGCKDCARNKMKPVLKRFYSQGRTRRHVLPDNVRPNLELE